MKEIQDFERIPEEKRGDFRKLFDSFDAVEEYATKIYSHYGRASALLLFYLQELSVSAEKIIKEMQAEKI